jgi:NitT/TauT family transport system substrate-binding protein
LGAFLLFLVLLGAGTLIYKVGQDANTIYWITLTPQQQQAQIEKHLIDGGVSWEPFPSQCNEQGITQNVLWSGEIWPGHPCCVLAVRQAYAQENRDMVTRVIRASMDANQWLLETVADPSSGNFTTLCDLAASITATTPSAIAESFKHVSYSTDITQHDMEDMASFGDMFIGLNQMTVQTLNSRGYQNTTQLVEAMVDTSYYEDAKSVKPSDVVLGTVHLGNIQADMHDLALILAENAQIFGRSLYLKYGINAVFPNPAGFSNGGAVMDAFATELLDMADLGCAPAILKMVNADVKVTIVSMANEEGSGIFATPGVEDFAGLRGKCVATPGPSSIQYLMLLYQAQKEGIQVKLRGT